LFLDLQFCQVAQSAHASPPALLRTAFSAHRADPLANPILCSSQLQIFKVALAGLLNVDFQSKHDPFWDCLVLKCFIV
jgi:hypothetical protein